jgi:hypothetical protein
MPSQYDQYSIPAVTIGWSAIVRSGKADYLKRVVKCGMKRRSVVL